LLNTGPQFSDTETFKPSTGRLLNPLISCAADFPAKILASPGKGLDLAENVAASGSSMQKRSTRSNRATSSSKMLPPFALADWIKYSGRSLRSGMMRNGIVYPHAPLVPLTSGIGCGLWLTPTAGDTKPACKREILEPATRNGKQWNLRGQATEISQLGTPLNPLFLEWLMGYPTGWTEIEPLEIASSRKSRK
jgi:hypothetical protein